jgi:hypothetical protein
MVIFRLGCHVETSTHLINALRTHLHIRDFHNFPSLISTRFSELILLLIVALTLHP